MSGFTKLVPEIVNSSIWNLSSDIRIVWITMLAIKDADGYVRGDARTIARLANVSLAACEEALQCFQSPDPSSHTPDNDGKRIAPAAGGWIVLNHEKYRELGMSESKKQYWREQKAKRRHVSECLGMSGTIPGQVSETPAFASASASASGGELRKATTLSPTIKPPWPRAGFDAAAKNLSIPDAMRDSCWAYYDSQGWVKSNGLNVSSGDPRSILIAWREKPQRFKDSPEPDRKPLKFANVKTP